MPDHELPIACTLSAADLLARRAEMAALGRAALLDVHAASTTARLRFAATADVRERVGELAAAEAHCCAFLEMAVTDEPGAVVLTVDAPAGAEYVLDELVAAFGAQAGQ